MSKHSVYVNALLLAFVMKLALGLKCFAQLFQDVGLASIVLAADDCNAMPIVFISRVCNRKNMFICRLVFSDKDLFYEIPIHNFTMIWAVNALAYQTRK